MNEKQSSITSGLYAGGSSFASKPPTGGAAGASTMASVASFKPSFSAVDQMGANKYETGSALTRSGSKSNIAGISSSAARGDNTRAYLGSPVRSTALNNSVTNMSAKVENPMKTNNFDFAEKSISQQSIQVTN